MNAEILQKYQELASRYQSVSDQMKKQLKLISMGRFISFVAIIPAFYFLYPINKILAISISVCFLASFLYLIKKFIQTEKQLLFHQRLIQINQDEIKALNHDFSAFDPGNEFTDPHHEYSYDLDLYGKDSLFQSLNRTVTDRGRNHLAFILNKSHRTISEIENKQTAIQELAEELNWRQNFIASGKETKDQKNQNQFEELLGHPVILPSAKRLQLLLKILPALTIFLIGLSIADVDSLSFYRLALFAQWTTIGLHIKTILKFHERFESQGKLLSHYVDMLQQIETMRFKSDHLTALKEKLLQNGKTASTITSEFQKILDQFDYSKNVLVGFVLDSIFLWDIRCLLKLYQWQQDHADDLPRWFEVIAEIDALISLANSNYNHPEWVSPVISNSGFHFKAEDLGHPLIAETRCIRNSFQIAGEEQIIIITGANMAGKSTFLRTVGVNLILASVGCKVCAASFEFSPICVYTNMRTSDNLMNDESYFYAELLRLQAMLNLIRKKENLFVIVDEMLKGTNSTDKLNGSKELINQLISLKTHGIVATHDLGLTELSQKYPLSIKNQCFEVQLHDDELHFDYKLSDGVTRTMNATFLMKKMGIIPKN